MARKTSSRVGCFSTYSTLAGGSSCLSSVEGAVHDDPTLVEDRDPVGELFGLVQVLRREQHRRAMPGEFLDGLPHLDAPLGVEPGRRLVEEDHRRIPDEAHRDVETAAHATRIGRRPCARPRRSARSARAGSSAIVPGSLRCRSRATSTRFSRPLRISSTAANCPVRLMDCAHVRSLRGDVEAVDAGGPRVGLEQGGQDVHDRGLARPVRAEQGEDAAPRRSSKSTPRSTCSSL